MLSKDENWISCRRKLNEKFDEQNGQSRSDSQGKNNQTAKTWVTKLWLVSILHLIGWESDSSFQNQTQNEVKLNQCNLGLLSTLNWKFL